MRNFLGKIFLWSIALFVLFLFFLEFRPKRDSYTVPRVGVDSYILLDMISDCYGPTVSVILIDGSNRNASFDIVFKSKDVGMWDLFKFDFFEGPKTVLMPHLDRRRWITIDEWRMICELVFKNLNSFFVESALDRKPQEVYLKNLDGLRDKMNIRLSQIPSVQKIIVADSSYLESFAEIYGFRFINLSQSSQRTSESVRLAEFLAKNWVSRVVSFEKNQDWVRPLVQSGDDLGWDFDVVRVDQSKVESSGYEELALYFCDLIVGDTAMELEFGTIDDYLSQGGGSEY